MSLGLSKHGEGGGAGEPLIRALPVRNADMVGQELHFGQNIVLPPVIPVEQ